MPFVEKVVLSVVAAVVIVKQEQQIAQQVVVVQVADSAVARSARQVVVARQVAEHSAELADEPVVRVAVVRVAVVRAAVVRFETAVERFLVPFREAAADVALRGAGSNHNFFFDPKRQSSSA